MNTSTRNIDIRLSGKTADQFIQWWVETHYPSDSELNLFMTQPLDLKRGAIDAFFRSKNIFVMVNPFQWDKPSFYVEIDQIENGSNHSIHEDKEPDHSPTWEEAWLRAVELVNNFINKP